MTRSNHLRSRVQFMQVALRSLVLILSAALVGAGADRLLTNLSLGWLREQPLATVESMGEGQRITIPESSRLRSELMVVTVTAREIQPTSALAAVVEADPERTTKVRSPATGRVVDLKVHLGDRVARQQQVAVILPDEFLQAQFESARPDTWVPAIAAQL
jgi:multidrug efflux pump subunit AcrA (membrane-fusion protein)